ncbi:UNVERIFIED_CONTAM: hypothetical protein GTU68_028789 [Idotea baltica]|nr:hypothetical protein [Idotea baltica]
MKKYFISGIDTGIGKTLCSAILAECLKADYWKPIQAGDLDNSDSITVSKLITNNKTKIHLERFKLNTSASPHYSAAIDNVDISLSDFSLPKTENTLIVEGAGGLLVPINEYKTIIDLIKFLDIPVILVSKNYLGSINHTLMSLEILKINNIKVGGIIFNGTENTESQRIIQKLSNVKLIGCIPEFQNVDKKCVEDSARKLMF